MCAWRRDDGRHCSQLCGPGVSRFRRAGSRERYLPADAIALTELELDVTPDFASQSVSVEARLKLSARAGGARRRIDLDQRELDIHAVLARAGGEARACRFTLTDTQLRVTLPDGMTLAPGSDVELEVSLHATPRFGLRFVGPDEDHPDRPQQLWSLNQEENSQHWFPCLDHPSARPRFALTARIPQGMTAISNGRLEQDDEESGLRVMRYVMDEPLPLYLTTLVVGEFEVIEADCDGLPVRYLAPPGRADDARRTLSRTPEMIRFLQDWTGMAFPFNRYDQVLVHDYLFGGMEHSSATTLTERTLRDERAMLDSHSEHLVSHELAHQWFGNSVTCREWPHGWLNEGFATYVEALWLEHAHGKDEARGDMLEVLEGYLTEARDRYTRPIVERTMFRPLDLFDAHLYNKGAVVLHALRGQLGDAAFQAAIRLYLERHAPGEVTTGDLMRAFEDASGRRLDQSFEELVYNPGHPELEGSWDWDDAAQVLRIDLRQTQDASASREAFSLDLELAIFVAGAWRRERVLITERRQTVALSLSEEPRVVSLDPEGFCPGPISWKPSEARLRVQLAEDAEVVGRIRAARALASQPSAQSVAALRHAVEGDPFWRVAAEAAAALGKIAGARAAGALSAALPSASHPKVRKAIAEALGATRARAALPALHSILDSDEPSLFVEAAACEALGKAGGAEEQERLEKALEGRESWHDEVRAGALKGLASIGDVARSLPLFEAWSHPRVDLNLRMAATRGIGELAVRAEAGLRVRARDRLCELVGDDSFRVQLSAIRALAKLGDSAASASLRQQRDRDLDGRVQRACREALESLDAAQPAAARIASLEQRLDAALDRERGLEQRVATLEARLSEEAPR